MNTQDSSTDQKKKIYLADESGHYDIDGVSQTIDKKVVVASENEMDVCPRLAVMIQNVTKWIHSQLQN